MGEIEFSTGRIYKLSVGIGLQTYYTLGHFNKEINSTIVEIIEDTNFLIKYGMTKHLVIVENSKTQERWLWVSPTNLPFLIQYSNPKGEPENII